MRDSTGDRCPRCLEGTLRERSLHDDWEGLLTCEKCGDRTPRWTYDKEIEKR